MVNVTEVKFTNIEDVATFQGEFSGAELQERLIDLYPFLENCSFTETVNLETGVKTIIFTEKLGTKGLF